MWDLIVSVPDNCLSFYFFSVDIKILPPGVDCPLPAAIHIY